MAETIALIDAENVRRSRWPNLSGRELLLRSLDWANREGVRAWLVFDGPTPGREVGEEDLGEGHKAVGTGHESADDWIIGRVQELRSKGQAYWLITSDRQLRDLAGGGASRLLGGGTFVRELGASRDVANNRGMDTGAPSAETTGMSEQRKVRVLVVDDDHDFIELITASFNEDQRLEVVGSAANGEEAVKQAAALRPEVVAMDISMPILDGIEATRLICRADAGCRVVLFSGSMFQERSEGRDVALDAGASSYVAKSRVALDLADAVVAAAHGEAVTAAN